MAIVTYDVNVKFNSVLDDVVVLRETGSERTVVLWDNLPPADQTLLTNIINDLGGSAPLAGPVAGKASINYSATVVGANPTGLDPLVSATSGAAVINFSVAKTGGDVSGLAGSGIVAAGYQLVTFIPLANGGDVTGLANNATVYTATITVDGVVKPVAVTGSAAQTMTALVAEINDDLGAAAVASLDSGNIRITSATTGAASTIAIVDGTLFAGIPGRTVVVDTAVAGVAPTNANKTYTAMVEVDGVLRKVSFTGGAGTTLANVATEIDNDLGVFASVAVTGGDLVITSASTGVKSKVRVFDTGWLFSSLTDFDSTSYVDGKAPTVYTTNVVVDGVAVPVSVQGSDAQTFTTLVAAINTDLGAAATAAISGSSIVITSATTGAASKVDIISDSLFSSTVGYTGVRSVAGAADLVDAMSVIRMANGTTALGYFPHTTVAVNRPVKPIAGSVPKTINHIYWGGASPDWRYYNDDTAV